MKFDPSSQFFVIDSDNIQDVETHLYGYIVYKDSIIQNNNLANFDFDIQNVYAGCYVYVGRNTSSVVIKQDFIGSYGVYLYRDKNYFAISNSFYMLFEHLKASRKISFDMNYASAFISAPLCSIAFSDTPVKEIKMLPRNVRLEIPFPGGELGILPLDYEENSIEVDSPAALEMLDAWFYKWTSIIRTIKAETDFISADLSGGFDSRTVFGLLASANIDLATIRINSAADALHTHKEDYEIASEIAQAYHISLNGGSLGKRKVVSFDSMDDTLNISFYTKLGFHKEMYFRYSCGIDPMFSFTGAGGECIRSYWNQGESGYRGWLLSCARRYSDFLTKYVSQELDATFAQLKQKFGIAPDQENEYLLHHLYRETRCRNHFGKALVESYMSNTLTLTPLLDYELSKIKLNSSSCKDKNLLLALIFVRFFPRLLEFRIEGGRSIDSATIAEARRINALAPFVNQNLELETLSAAARPETKSEASAAGLACTNQEVRAYLRSVFFSHKFKHTFCLSFPDHVYERMCRIISRAKYFPLSEAYAAIALEKYISGMPQAQPEGRDTITGCLDALSRSQIPDEADDIQDREAILKYCTARIDLKNAGSEKNSLIVLENKNGVSDQPKWFGGRNGQGTVVTSLEYKNRMSVKIQCVGSGQLNIDLRGVDFRLADKTRFPVWICYTKFAINNVPVLKDDVCVCHDVPFTYSLKVSDGDQFVLDLEWNALDSDCLLPKAVLNAADDVPDRGSMLKYGTARVDLKNAGSEKNSLIVLENKNGFSDQPEWFGGRNGQGTVVTSLEDKRSMSVKIQCVGSGQLGIVLRGVDFRLADKTRFPVWICYTKFAVNNVPVLKEDACVCHEGVDIKRRFFLILVTFYD